MQPVLDALTRVDAGGVPADDFEAIGDRWDIRQKLATWLKDHDLGHLATDQLVANLGLGRLWASHDT